MENQPNGHKSSKQLAQLHASFLRSLEHRLERELVTASVKDVSPGDDRLWINFGAGVEGLLVVVSDSPLDNGGNYFLHRDKESFLSYTLGTQQIATALERVLSETHNDRAPSFERASEITDTVAYGE
jgi:hypothetical protein